MRTTREWEFMALRILLIANVVSLLMVVGLLLGGFIHYKLMCHPLEWSPDVRVDLDMVSVYDDYVFINLSSFSDCNYVKFADTNSMIPNLDGEHKALMCEVPKEELKEGDVISFNVSWSESKVAHRIYEIGEDNDGWFARTKGDNSGVIDGTRVRYDDISGTMVLVIY